MCHSLGRLPILCVTLLRTTEGCEFGDFFWPPVIFLRKLLMDLIWVSVLPASWAIRKKSSMMSWERNPGIFLFLFIFIFPCFFGLLLVIKSAYIQQVNKICPLFYSYFPSFFPFPSFFSFFPPLLPQNSSLCSNFCQKITGIYIPVQYKGEKSKIQYFSKSFHAWGGGGSKYLRFPLERFWSSSRSNCTSFSFKIFSSSFSILKKSILWN